MLASQILLLAAVLALLALRPRSWSAAALPTVVAALELGAGIAPLHAVARAAAETVPLGLFLTSAVWLARLAEHAGLAKRIAGALARTARGRKPLLYFLVCAVCALLTSSVSLDGAVVLMAPLLLQLTRRSPELFRPLLMGTVAVANAFSLAVPQGNPTNLVVMERLKLPAAAFVTRLFVPALLATVVCAAAAGLVDRKALRGRYPDDHAVQGPLSGTEMLAVAAFAAAALAGVAAPWLGIAPWWSISLVAAVSFAGAHALRRPVPAPRVPWRVCSLVAALVVLLDALFAPVGVPTLRASSLAALIGLSLLVAAVSSVANNLPASVVFASVLGSPGLTAYGALTGLSVGALATPHGSVATLIALDRAGRRAAEIRAPRYLALWVPATALATAGAATCMWWLAKA